MNSQLISISIYCREDCKTLNNALGKLQEDGYKLSLRFPDIPELLLDSVIIVRESDINSPVMKYLFEQHEINNKILFIIPEEDSLLISSLIKKGFNNFFVFPYEYYLFVDYMKEILDNISYHTEVSPLAASSTGFDDLIGNSKEIRKVIDVARKIADKKDLNVLITGETGTGKGLLAKSIHDFGDGNKFPFVDITCTSIPESLLESELFGHEAGAFTSARTMKPGLFELAENGTLFLDEIGDLSTVIQSKLLRTLDKKVIRRLGGINDIAINTRIISATNADLEKHVRNNLFRTDLYHRLNTISIEIPPLRCREGDILLLFNHFMEYFCSNYNKPLRKLEPAVKDYILTYNWPGNIRELRNFVERIILLHDETTIRLKHIISQSSKIEKAAHPFRINPSIINLDLDYEKTDLKSMEKLYAKETLSRLNGNKSKTAKLLGISRPKLDDLLNN